MKNVIGGKKRAKMQSLCILRQEQKTLRALLLCAYPLLQPVYACHPNLGSASKNAKSLFAFAITPHRDVQREAGSPAQSCARSWKQRGENAALCGCISSVASSSTGRERQGKHWYLNCKSACKSISSQVFSATCSSSSLKPDGMEEAQFPCWVCLLGKGQLALSFCPSRHIH